MNPLAVLGASGAEHAGDAAGSDPGTVFLHLFQHVQAHKLFSFGSPEGTTFVITNHTVLQVMACLLAFGIFYYVARRAAQSERPTGAFCNAFESVVLYVRDEMVSKFMTKEHAEKLLPLFLTFFIFILFTNLIGLIPMGKHLSGTATANISVTCALATITFGVMIIGGMMIVGPGKFWTSLVPHGIPAFVVPLMFVIEVAGLLIKAFALMMRLFANMVAGHLVILSFFSLVILFQSYAVMVPAVLMAVFITLLEVLVAFIQAYVFTFLSILFVSMCIHPEH